MPKLFPSELSIDSSYPLLPEHRGLLGKARVLGRDLYLERTYPAVGATSAIWFAASSVGEICEEDGVFSLHVKQILVNADVQRGHPRVAELIAIEEAVRIHMIDVLWFGPCGYLAHPDEVELAHMVAGDHQVDEIVPLNPKQFIAEKFPDGWIDPQFSLPETRMAGLEAGKVCAMRLDDRLILQAYIDNNLRFVNYFRHSQSPSFHQIGEEQFRIMRNLYSDLFRRK